MLKDLDKPEFIARLMANEEAAFDTLYRELAPTLRSRFIKKWSFTVEDSEDLVIHTLQKFLRSLHTTFNPEKGLVGYILMIAERLAVDHFKELIDRSEEQLTHDPEDDHSVVTAPAVEGERELSPDELLVRQELEKLDEVNQRIIILRVRDEWKFGEIARALGMTEKAVENRYRRGMRKLKDGVGKAKAG